MSKAFGTARYYRGKMYFDDRGWGLLKEVAKKTHQSPKTLLHAALRRYIRSRKHGK